MAQRTLFTVGHSTRTWREFVELLKAWKIEELIDVRTVPRSQAFPWFDSKTMGGRLAKEGIGYVHLAGLGGLRRAKKESQNVGWRNASFRGYADYIQTVEFAVGLKELDARRRRHRVCIMCSEAVWWRCHRRMIADVLEARGIPVRHIMSEKSAKRHEMTAFAVVNRHRGRPPIITYPQQDNCI
ncbi:MAG: DUF488 domain-containing protein [Phycisphaerales bacterium]|nr:DUF488 domain-containing protein [Phycisphaerales bacterium]